MTAKYIYAACTPWHANIYERNITCLAGEWHYVDNSKVLTIDYVREIDPRYIFFPHWSWVVPDSIVRDYECICFHMADVPYGRGGSPLQNLIMRGHRDTMMSALRMTSELDAGPVYLKKPLSLEGGAEEIYIRAAKCCAAMIEEIIVSAPSPEPQCGPPVVFKRRKPKDSMIPSFDESQQLFDFVRMLDADGYPKAYIVHEGFRYSFTRVAQYNGKLRADVEITREGE